MAFDSLPEMVLDRRQQPSAAPFRRQRRPEERVRALGTVLDFVRPQEVMLALRRAVEARHQAVIANHNAHSLRLMRGDPEFAAFFEAADLVQIDSQPLILWSMLLGRRSRRFHRSTYLDWRDDFWTLAQSQGWRVFYLGGAPGVVEQAAWNIRQDYPRARIGGRNGFFDAAPGSRENAAVLAELEAFEPDVLLVGMGMPRQELWIARNRARLPSCPILPVGGAFDYEAGVQRPAPRWMGRVGLEWAFRLAQDPRRLFHRYCLEPWGLVGPLALDLAGRVSEGARRADPAELEADAIRAAVARRGEWRAR